MTSTAGTTDRAHPITAGVSAIEHEIKTLRDQPAWSMNPTETRDAMVRLTKVEAQLVELQARVTHHGTTIEVEAESGATSTANWWAHNTRQTRAAAHRRTKLAKALGAGLHEPVRDALADGRLLTDQAEVIIAAVQTLPADLVDDDLRRRAQATLIGYAGQHDAQALRILGRRILDVVAPEVGEAWEARKLAAEVAEAEKAASFQMHEDGHGKAHGRFTVPSDVAAQLKKALLAYAAPKHRASVDGHAPDPERPSAHKMGLAFCEYIRRYPTGNLPHSGGVAATVVVTMDLDTLLGGLKAAQLDTGHRISPGLARKIACEAGIIPPSSVATRRSSTWAGRPGSTPPRNGSRSPWSRAAAPPRVVTGPRECVTVHHDEPWSEGGPTDLKNGRLLCPRHHARAHDATYTITQLPEGKVRFHRRT